MSKAGLTSCEKEFEGGEGSGEGRFTSSLQKWERVLKVKRGAEGWKKVGNAERGVLDSTLSELHAQMEPRGGKALPGGGSSKPEKKRRDLGVTVS